MLNKVILVATLCKDPEMCYTIQDIAVCNLRLASSRTFKKTYGQDKEEVVFITATVWGKRAENCAKYLKKGSHIFVEGRLQTKEWLNKEGNKTSTIELYVEDIQFLDRVKEGTSQEEEGEENA